MKRFSSLAAAALAAGMAAPAQPMAQTRGMVADFANHSVFVFDAGTNSVVGGMVALPPGASTVPNVPVTTGDCAVTEDNTRAFVTDLTSRVHVIDLTVPGLAPGPNSVSIDNPGTDVAISPDEKFLVVAGGTSVLPLSVIDIATRTNIGTASVTGSDHNSMDVCGDGSVLATSLTAGELRRATIDGNGVVTNTADVLSGLVVPRNVTCAPNSKSGVLVDHNIVRSFTIPGLASAGTQGVAGAIAAAFNPAGNSVYVRTVDAVLAFSFNATTGAFGPLLFTITPLSATTFYGIDQIAISPDGGKLYVGANGQISVFDAATGGALTPIALAASARPTGICFARAPLPATDRNLDKFLMYKLADSEIDSEADDEVEEDEARKVAVALHDDFDGTGQTRRYVVKEALRLGNPADVNDEGILNADGHLVAYKIHRAKGAPKNARLTKVKVSNMFGELMLDTKQPNRLMVPSALSRTDPGVEVPAQGGTDSFKCYRAGVTPYTPSQPATAVSIVDAFNQPRVYNVLSVVRLCNPVDVNGTGIGNATGHLVCYGVERAKRQSKTPNVAPLYTNSALGPLTLGTKGAAELCVPSEKDMTSAEVVAEPVKPPKKPKK
jgi:WD40 repeat protein